MQNILVVGSINMDMLSSVGHFPAVGETLACESFSFCCGGKGDNQAVAAARLGAKVTMLAAVGDDYFAPRLLANLEKEGINTDAILKVAGVESGIANVVTCRGENFIVVAKGANEHLTKDYLLTHEVLFAEADIILAQLEVPLETVECASELAKKYQKPFILNPAPALKLSQQLLDDVTLLIPNEKEFAVSVDLNDSDVFGLLNYVTEKIVLTRGIEGAYYFNSERNGADLQPSFHVNTVDSTGAGDTFCAALAVFYELGIAEAVRYACAAAAISVCQHGAQTAMPTRAQLLSFLKEREGENPDDPYNRANPLQHDNSLLLD